MAWQLQDLTAAVDLSAAVEAGSLNVVQRAYAETSRLSAIIRDEAATIADLIDHELLLTDAAQKVFAGIVRQRKKGDTGVSGQRIYSIECQDYTTLLADDYAPSGAAGAVRAAGESDSVRIAALFTAFGTRGIAIGASVQTLKASMPAQDFTGKNLHQCLTMIASETGGSFFVDYDKVLHYFNSEVNTAPFGLSDAPNGTTTFGYEDFAEASDTVDFVNEVHVIGAPGVAVTRYLGGVPPTAGTRRATVVVDAEILDTAAANSRGDAVLASFGVTKKPSSLTTYKAGLRAGMNVQVTHAGWAISAATYRIAGLVARPGTKDRIRYEVDFGNAPVELSSLFSGALGYASAVGDVAAGAAAGLADAVDLSVGGANLIPNSSFEDGTSWVVGSQWAIGFTPTGGQLAFHGTDTGRAALSAQTAGDLVTQKIAVDRNDQYIVSAWHFIRSRSSGTFRMFVKEYNAANTLLASTNVNLTAVDSAWTREIIRFAPAAALNPTKIGWNAATAKIEIGFSSAGAAATLTVDVDGVQLERGEAPTAYAPMPREILPGTIGATEIADSAVTTPKLVALSVTTAKLAASAITADKLAATLILGSLIRAGSSSNRVELDSNGLRVYDATGALLVNMPTDASPVYITAEVVARTLQVLGNSTFRGAGNTFAPGSTVTIGNKTETPEQAPTLTAGWETLDVPYNGSWDYASNEMRRYGLSYDPAGGAAGTTKVFWTVLRGGDDATGGPDTWAIGEMLASTRALNRAVAFDSITTDKQPSIVRHSSWVYVLYEDFGTWIVKRYLASTLAYVDTLTPPGLPGTLVSPRITSDGTNVYIAYTSGNVVRWMKYDSTLNAIGGEAVTTGATLVPGTFVQAAYIGNADFGAQRMITVMTDWTALSYATATGVYQPDERFPTMYGTAGLTYGDALGDGARFWSMPAVAAPAGFFIFKHSTWVWTTASSLYWVAYSWYDSVGTVHETPVGPRASISMGRRQILTVAGSAVPVGAAGVDDPDQRRIYMVPSSTAPATTALKLQAALAGTTYTMTGYNAAGAAPATTNNFPSGNPASIKAQNGEWELKGDGTIAGGVVTTFAINNGGTATFTGKYCEWLRVGRLVVFRLLFTVSAAGNGAVGVTITGTGMPELASGMLFLGDKTGPATVIARSSNSGGSVALTQLMVNSFTAVATGAALASGDAWAIGGAYVAL